MVKLGIIIERFMNTYFMSQYDWDPLISAFSLEPRKIQNLINIGIDAGLYLVVYLASKRMRREKRDFCIRDWISRTKVIPEVEYLFILVIEDFVEGLALGGLMGTQARSAADSTVSRLEMLGADKEKKWGIKIMNFIDSGEASKYSVRFRFAMNAFEIFLRSQLASGDGIRMEASDYRDSRMNPIVNEKMKAIISKSKKAEYKSAISAASMDSVISTLRDVTSDQSMTIHAYKMVFSKVILSLYPERHEFSIICKP